MSVSVFSPKTAGRESEATNKAENFGSLGTQMFIHILAIGGGPRGKGARGAHFARAADANLGKFISSASSNGAVIKAFFIF